MLENNFSCLDDNELMEINGGVIDPATIAAIGGAVVAVIGATSELIRVCKEGK